LAVKLRLRRLGRKKRPVYELVAADARAPRDGRFIESLGQYDPLSEPPEIRLKEDRVLYWLRNGAIPTETARSLLRQAGILLRWHLEKWGKSPEEIQAAYEEWKARREAKREAIRQQVAARKQERLEQERRLAQQRAAAQQAASEPSSQSAVAE